MDAKDREKAQQQAIENMLGEALRRGSPPVREACPEPDRLAAYFEQSLDPAETAKLELHISDCNHCQEVLAALATTALEPALAQEFAMASAPVMPTPKPRPFSSFETDDAPLPTAPEQTPSGRASWLSLHWRWLTPAVSLAAVAVLWFTIGQPTHPTPRVDVAVSTSTEPVPLSRAAEPAPKSENDRIAKNLELAPPGRKQASEFAKRKKPPLDSRPTVATRAADASAPSDALAERTLASAPSAKPSGVPSATPPPQIAAADRSEVGKLSDEKKESRELGSRAVGGVAGNVIAPRSPAAQHSGRERLQQSPSQTPVQSQGRQQSQVADAPAAGATSAFKMRDSESNLKALQKTSLPSLHVIVTPDPLILWRVGQDGKVERTVDGQNWQTQASGVTASLAAGSAPSTKICWVAGAAGVILRTTDGEHWEKIAPPAPLDWIRIVADDAQHAIVTSADQKQFITTDGGRTWKAQ
jgi:hypothetical protein